MKRLLLLLIVFTALRSAAQISVTVIPDDTLACYHDSIVLEAVVTGQTNVFYKWLKNGAEVPFAEDSLLIFPHVTAADTGYYQCVVTYATETDTSNFAHIRVYDEIIIDTLYRYNELGCPGICKGQFKTHVSGGLPPYDYNWGGGFSQDTLVFGLCPGWHTLTIKDMRGCKEDSAYFVAVLHLPKVTFDVKPNDTVYLTNPIITMEFPDTARPYMVNWEWTIKKAPDTTEIYSAPNINPAGYTFDSTGTFQVYLHFTDQNGCDSTVVRDVVVKTADLLVPYVFTPGNSDGSDMNETFMVRVKNADNPKTFDYRTAYMGTELQVWDRWGKLVYSKKDYESGSWDGDNLAEGVYFFILTCKGKWEDDIFRGSVTILR
jgi:hypothetical protein